MLFALTKFTALRYFDHNIGLFVMYIWLTNKSMLLILRDGDLDTVENEGAKCDVRR
jgi:hypothetical protein